MNNKDKDKEDSSALDAALASTSNVIAKEENDDSETAMPSWFDSVVATDAVEN